MPPLAPRGREIFAGLEQAVPSSLQGHSKLQASSSVPGWQPACNSNEPFTRSVYGCTLTPSCLWKGCRLRVEKRDVSPSQGGGVTLFSTAACRPTVTLAC